MMSGNENSERTLIILEDMQTKIEFIAEGYLQLVEGQKRLGKKIEWMPWNSV